ncbi:MAG: hypothetical protein K5984_03300 [Bacteroidales bacterium]|nr:hypothetical protein [Bacteroidales bacterium]
MKKILLFVFTICGILISVPSFSCTSVIVSGKATKSGRPVIFKNRDTGNLNNRVTWIQGEKYGFIGLENASKIGEEEWGGTNEAGFCIINTASYNIKDDDVPSGEMDKEGLFMYKALGVCATIADFEKFLDEYPRPMGVETNFGVIDADGGAAYYEVNNHKWVKYDVNDPEVAPRGYRVQTNFSECGRREDYQGYERYLTASAIMDEAWDKAEDGRMDIDAMWFVNNMSRAYRHEVLGVNYNDNYDRMVEAGAFNGTCVDQDFIPRRITSSVISMDGVKKGENPLHTVMWTTMGYPSVVATIPLMVCDGDRLPAYVKSEGKVHSELCDLAMKIKSEYVFPSVLSNGKHYLRLDNVLKGTEGRPSLVSCCKSSEKAIGKSFGKYYGKWVEGRISDDEFFSEYVSDQGNWMKIYKKEFDTYIK